MKRRNEVLVGILVTVAVVVGVFGTLWLARRGFSTAYPLHTRFAWGAGLKQGQQVLLAGVQVGYVDKVELRNDGWLDVTMRIEKNYEVPEGTVAEVKQISFFGDMAVALKPRLGARGAISPGDTVPAGKPAPSMDDIIARLDTVTRGVSDVAQAFEIQLVKGGGIADLRETIGATNRLVERINVIAVEQSRGIGMLTASLRRTVNAVDSLSVDSTVRNLEMASRNLAALSGDLQQTTTRLNGVLGRLENGDGTASKLLNDPGLYNDMRSLVTRLDSLTVDFKKNPRRYINLKIF